MIFYFAISKDDVILKVKNMSEPSRVFESIRQGFNKCGF